MDATIFFTDGRQKHEQKVFNATKETVAHLVAFARMNGWELEKPVYWEASDETEERKLAGGGVCRIEPSLSAEERNPGLVERVNKRII